MNSSMGSLLIVSYIIPDMDSSSRIVFAVSIALFTSNMRLWISCWSGLLESMLQFRSFSAAPNASLYVIPNNFEMILSHSIIPFPNVVASGNSRLSEVAILMTTYSPAKSCAYKNRSSALIAWLPSSLRIILLGEYPEELSSKHCGCGLILLTIVNRSSV